MNAPAKPLHLVDRAARYLREYASSEPESALVTNAFGEPVATGGSARRSPSPPIEPVGPALAIETLERAGMIPSREQRDRIAEEFRVVSQRVLATIESVEEATPRHNLVMVTSARAGEGKSFAALNLAASLALSSEHPIILADADIRPGSLTEALGLENRPGVLDIVASPLQLGEATLVGSRVKGLSFLPIGGGTDPDGRALISVHHPIAGLIATLARQFTDSVFVIDAPPCLSSSDPAALAAVVGQAVLVVQAEKTRRKEIEAALDLIEACPNIRLLLNKITLTTRGTFGAYL